MVHLRSISRDAVGRCPSIVAPHQPRLFARSSHQWVCTILVECQQDTTSTDKTIAIHVIVSNTLCIRSIRVLQVPQPSSDQTHYHYQTNPANHENTSAIRLEQSIHHHLHPRVHRVWQLCISNCFDIGILGRKFDGKWLSISTVLHCWNNCNNLCGSVLDCAIGAKLCFYFA